MKIRRELCACEHDLSDCPEARADEDSTIQPSIRHPYRAETALENVSRGGMRDKEGQGRKRKAHITRVSTTGCGKKPLRSVHGRSLRDQSTR